MRQKYYRISIIGAGGVAWQLAPALESAGHTIEEIYSRSYEKALALSLQLYQASVIEKPDFSKSHAEILIIAVNDDAIQEVAPKLILPSEGTIVVHTSGSQPLSTLQDVKTVYTGVFYPLQTFTYDKHTNFSNIPICLESDNSHALKVLTKIAKSISRTVKLISSKERAVLHVAAVFACNFSNHLLSIAESLMKHQHLDLALLKPLITETIHNSLTIGPQKAQTGPAVRNDQTTINRHMAFLKKHDPEYAKIYDLLTKHIREINK